MGQVSAKDMQRLSPNNCWARDKAREHSLKWNYEGCGSCSTDALVLSVMDPRSLQSH